MIIPEQNEDEEVGSIINQIFSKDLIKKLFYHACRPDIPDNNEKAELIQELIGDEFVELGTGTNRMAFVYNPDDDRESMVGSNLVISIALDKQGMIDNWTEFKRSVESPESIVKGYETNLLILVEQYLTVMDIEEFRLNREPILEVLSQLSKVYIFGDIGYYGKNFANWGYDTQGNIKIVDAGYMYPIKGNEQALICPRCRARIRYNQNYTEFVCSNKDCRNVYDFTDIRDRMNLDIEKMEDKVIAAINDIELPDLDEFLDEFEDI